MLSRPRLVQLGAGALPVPGMTVHRWHLGNHWALHLCRSHSLLEAAGKSMDITPGTASLIPPRSTMTFTRIERGGPHLWALFRFDAAGNRELHHMLAGNWCAPAGESFASLWTLFLEAIGRRPLQPLRAEVIFWDLLWRVLDHWTDSPRRTGSMQRHAPPELVEACRHIELRLAQPLRVAEIARQVGVSHNHLTLLFQRHLHTTVVDYIRTRRMVQASLMLSETGLPIKVVAAEVGIPDLHQFNKAIRREFGLPPSRLRGP
ncbi:MAG: helix-turn-helix transcriptional regulator [Phycisphaeraceae bacterium]|nr:helix-turn-helix transcriptional regulator [Phycisphaeraceae bacterium]